MDEGEDTFSAIVVPHLADALTTALWLTGNRADAEDVVQEACLRAHRAIARYAGGSARAWVLAIVRNTAFTWLRKKRRTELVAVDDLEADDRAFAEHGGSGGDPNAGNPENKLIARADAERLRAAIERLPLEFRETLILRDIQELDYREIAQVTAVPVGTVMSRLSRARRRLIRDIVEEPVQPAGPHG